MDMGSSSYLPLTSVIEMKPMMGRDVLDWISQILGGKDGAVNWLEGHSLSNTHLCV